MMMLFRVGLALLIGFAQATEFTTDSVVGRRILEKATAITPSKFLTRRLQENSFYGYSNLASMTIRYIGCSTFNTYATNNYAQQGNGQQQQGDQMDSEYWYYQNMARDDAIGMNNLVRFTICSGAKCSGSCDGEYVMSMEEFLEAYTEWKMDHASFWCERVRERCYCNPYATGSSGSSYSWKDCYSACFEQSPYGLTYQGCLEANANEEGNVFQIQQYLECNGIMFYNPDFVYNMEYGNGNGNNNQKFSWGNYFYLGLSCVNNANVELTAYYDNQCSYKASTDDLQNAMGSYNDIPYLKGAPVLAKGTCIDCMTDNDAAKAQESGNNAYAYQKYNNYNNYGGNNWEDQPDANDLCAMVTGQSGDGEVIVCDESRYRTSGCEWIKNALPSLDGRFHITAEQFTSLSEQFLSSERAQWALAGLVLALIGAMAMWMGYQCAEKTPRADPQQQQQRRAKLLPEGGDDSLPISSQISASQPSTSQMSSQI